VTPYRHEVHPYECVQFLTNFTKPGSVVVDAMAGTCSMAIAAQRTGRFAICIDKDKESGMFEAARLRVQAAFLFYSSRGLHPAPGTEPHEPTSWELNADPWETEYLRDQRLAQSKKNRAADKERSKVAMSVSKEYTAKQKLKEKMQKREAIKKAKSEVIKKRRAKEIAARKKKQETERKKKRTKRNAAKKATKKKAAKKKAAKKKGSRKQRGEKRKADGTVTSKRVKKTKFVGTRASVTVNVFDVACRDCLSTACVFFFVEKEGGIVASWLGAPQHAHFVAFGSTSHSPHHQ
jgi:flagellar biosynthesis GTPase FlhF